MYKIENMSFGSPNSRVRYPIAAADEYAQEQIMWQRQKTQVTRFLSALTHCTDGAKAED